MKRHCRRYQQPSRIRIHPEIRGQTLTLGIRTLLPQPLQTILNTAPPPLSQTLVENHKPDLKQILPNNILHNTKKRGASPITQKYSFNNTYELEKIAEDQIEQVENAPVYVQDPETDELNYWPFRDGKITEDSRELAGVVSSNDDFYHTIQYDNILEDTANALQRQQNTGEDLEIKSGTIDLADDYHKMYANTILTGSDVELNADPAGNDPIKTGLNIQTGHSGFHGLKIQPAALREICSNGMKGWVAEKEYEQTHSEPYQPELIEHGVQAIIEGTDQLEERLHQAQQQELVGGKDELRLIMHETIDEYLEQPVADIPMNIEQETGEDTVSLYDAYQAMTRALTHHAKDSMPQYKIDEGFETAAQLLENGRNRLPNAERLGENYVQNRVQHLVEDPETEEYWDGETQDVRELMEEHNLAA